MIKLTPREKELINKIKRQNTKANQLKYGFKVASTDKEINQIQKIHRKYETLVWGVFNNADNHKLLNEEIKLVKKFCIKNDTTLEVGCGSGRFTLFLSKNTKQVAAMDHSKLIIKNFRKIISDNKIKNIKVLAQNFVHTNFKNHFNVIFLIENLMGMNLHQSTRKKIIRKAFNAVTPNGTIIFGYRLNQNVRPGKIIYQAMPFKSADHHYHHQYFGFAINWGKSSLKNEILTVLKSKKFMIIDEFIGSNRPAGGRMAYLVLKKNELK